MNRDFQFSIDEFYHIYNRGNDKRNIFLNNSDRERFIKLLFLCNSSNPVDIANLSKKQNFWEVERNETLVNIGAYCLMPNHFHLLLHEKSEKGISLFMQKLSTAYSMYFNKKSNRTGSLFEGRFKASHVNKDVYLKYLFAYIHLNPIKIIDQTWKEKKISNIKQAKEYLKNYKYSSYFDYTGINRETKIILNKNAFPKYFDSTKEFKDFVNDWLNYDNSEGLTFFY